MAKDTLTLTLNGNVPLDLFATALEHFDALIKALTEEVVESDAAPIEWQVLHLQNDSVFTTIRGITKGVEKQENQVAVIEKVVQAFTNVGKALERKQPIPYSKNVDHHAKALTFIINGQISSIQFVTDDYTADIKERIAEEQLEPKQYSLGTISGTVRTISEEPRLRFSLYDDLFDKVVYCYLNQEQQELARSIWRKRVSVAGLIYRDLDTGRPIEVREVYKVEVLDFIPPQSYREAKGVLPWHNGDEPAEVSIRRLRDA
jgi:hypothetical protein